MIKNQEMQRLRGEKNYFLAEKVMKNIIHHRCPDNATLEQLYGYEKAGIIRNNIEIFLNDNSSSSRIPRDHNYNTPSEIYNARTQVEKNRSFQKIHSALLKYELPEISDLKVFYGNYSDMVLKIIRTYEELNLKRKCELFAATHLNRTGAVVYQLKMDDEDSYKYSTVAMMHDSIEDLLDFGDFRKTKGLDILKYKKFLNEFIPLELQQPVKMLTNHYNFIFNFIIHKLDESDKSINLKNILAVLEKLLKKKLEDLHIYVEKMFELLSNRVIEENILVNARWECYKNLYLNGIAESSKRIDDYRIFEIKGIDLSDNAHGKGSLSVEGKIRNINKNVLWGILGYNLHSSWIPLNNHIQEIIEDALLSAEAIILSDLLQKQSSQDFVMSALYKIKKLEPIFYI
jgi:hypothetical protein